MEVKVNKNDDGTVTVTYLMDPKDRTVTFKAVTPDKQASDSIMQGLNEAVDVVKPSKEYDFEVKGTDSYPLTDSGLKLKVEGWKPQIGEVVLCRGYHPDNQWCAGMLTELSGTVPYFVIAGTDYYESIAKFDATKIGTTDDLFHYDSSNINLLEHLYKK